MFETIRYPSRICVKITAATAAALEAVAADAGAPVASVAREAIERGLPSTREAWRKAKRCGGLKAGTEADG